MLKMIVVWFSVTIAVYVLAYFLWSVSPLISVGLAIAHGIWHAYYTATSGSGGTDSDSDDDDDKGSITHVGYSSHISFPKYDNDF